MLLVGRPQSFLEPNPQPGKPPGLICHFIMILVLSSGSSMPSRAKRAPPKTLLFPVAVPLLTLPITMPLIFAHIYLKRPRTSRRAKRQFMNELRKASCKNASSLHNSFCSPSPWLNSPLPLANSPLPLHLALTRLPILY